MRERFKDEMTATIFEGTTLKGISLELAKQAKKKIVLLITATRLDDLRVPPGNRLEKLEGDRKGQYSIRVNDQWRICFIWGDGQADEIEWCDYHS
jgi:proteic killer suppression protein